jgi:hypothetical protein
MEDELMADCTPRIVVAGDVSVDWLQWPAPPADAGLNWQLTEGTRWAVLPGGALLIAEMLRRAGGVAVAAPHLTDLEHSSPDRILQSLAELALCPAAGPADRQRVYRIARSRGYTGPREGPPHLLPVVEDDPQPNIVILNDGGNGFRTERLVWPAALTAQRPEASAAPGPLIVAQMAPPLLQGELWQTLRQVEPDRLVIVIDADDLRSAGVNISQRLSWERTAKDLVWQMACNPWLTPLANARHVVIRLGLEGGVFYSARPGGPLARLIFDPQHIEGGYSDHYPGQMRGRADAFVAALALTLACPPPEQQDRALDARLGPALRAGLAAALRVQTQGYGQETDIPSFPSPAILRPAADEPPLRLAEATIPKADAPEPPDPHFWCILEDVQGVEMEDLARRLVVDGAADALAGVPVGQFGKLRTADRAEIEGLRSIRNLIDEFLRSQAGRPLSVAVFGFPGSGKSFAVTQVAESTAGQHRIAHLEFNLSQFRSTEDLARAFHLVRDTALSGAMPLVFFDEFDAAFEGEMGWLKYFLAPMQDGVFREGEAIHPIGKAIFVFAGGTYNTFQDFAGLSADHDPESARRFKDVKAPDFVSRLRGFANILGPNPVSDEDGTYLIRRAMLLRSLVERKAPQVLDRAGRACIDEGLLRALLRTPAYHHGARSMEAILDMSMLAGKSRWEQAALPPAEQLVLHVDAPLFVRLMLRDILLTGAREVLGQAVHESYRRNQKSTKLFNDRAMQPWEALSEDLRESNRQQADHIPVKLRAVQCSYRPMAGSQPAQIDFSAGEIETMARLEHERWVVERRLAGWVYGPERDPDRKISPYLAPYDELPHDVQDLDRQAVRAIPNLLERAKFEVYRL